MKIASSRVKKFVIAGAILALVLIPFFAITCWQAAQKSTQPTPTPKPASLNYTNTKYGFVLKFPQYWLDEEWEDPVVTLTSPLASGCDFPATISVKVIGGLTDETLTAGLEDFVVMCEENLKKSAKNYTRISLDRTTISGLPAIILTWSMSDEKTQITKQAVVFKDRYVFIITYASQKEFNDLYVSAFELVISTFRFY